jgi:hypothetical protein
VVYLGSEQHISNARKARALGRQVASKQAMKRKDAYLQNPNRCVNCDIQLDFNKRSHKFCSSSCSASFNNSKRAFKKERKFSQKALDNIREAAKSRKSAKIRECKSKVEEDRFCKVCNSTFRVVKSSNKRTCSKECRDIACTSRTYRNGSRKTIEYKGVVLESTWELKVAEELDRLTIRWIRPKPIKWIDGLGKSRLYYPDFYLEEYDVFLDPKNPYCMVKDMEKMQCIESLGYKVVFGDIDKVITFIKELCKN